MKRSRPRIKQGLYDPRFEHDSCGVGFVCDIKGRKSRENVLKGLEVLERMAHRGAVGSDPKTGDGAGVLIQIPHRFYLEVSAREGIDLPSPGGYGTGIIFLPVDSHQRRFCEEAVEKAVEKEGQVFLGWRDVPVDDSIIGKVAAESQPVIRQAFIEKAEPVRDRMEFDRKLYVIRKLAENTVRESDISGKDFFYITNLSSRTVSYKGLLMPTQLRHYYLDLQDENVESSLVLVHSRYSTNTFPTWDLAQPFRFLAHNGEINTLRGNINWFRARERLLSSGLFGNDIEKIKPVIVEGQSDSATIDNVFELLVLAGRSLPHVMMMLIPAAWENNQLMDGKLRDFYEYHACLMEPWDGPAAIAFTDGTRIGAVLDRNGLRPARYIITKDGFVVMASEAGVLDIEPEDIQLSGRLEPGKMFFIDTEKGRIVDEASIKRAVSGENPYGKWNRDNIVELEDLPPSGVHGKPAEDLLAQLKAFGYTREDLRMVMKPMAEEGKEPIGSMGNDTPHAFLSRRPHLLYNYFKQLFAQVTNPAIDPIREELVMSITSYVGPEKNILEQTPQHCHKLAVKFPVLTNEELERVRQMNTSSFRSKTVHTYFDAGGREDFIKALERVCFEAEYAIEQGYSFVILSDRGIDRYHAALPALLAASAVHHHLVRRKRRSEVGLIVESAEPREVEHFALLFGYGADCVNPYLAYRTVEHLIEEGHVRLAPEEALANYRKALRKGILKILSKMGISTLRSYRGAQIFEAVGIRDGVVDKYFCGTVTRVGGVGLDEIAGETLARHRSAFPEREPEVPQLATGGVYQWRRDGEFHLWRPESIAALQDSVRKADYDRYKEFSELINDQSKNPTTLRSLLKFKETQPVPLSEVEPVESIIKRFATGAMSFGSISRGAHESIAIAMNRLGGKSNTGEGGEDPVRFTPLPDGSSSRSAIKQVASGRFGVSTNYLVNADEIQIKIAQGAKPGEGGQLPGHKVSAVIAKTRYTTPGVTLISPPPHHDIYSIEDLAQLIFDLKNTNPRARISVKLVSEIGVGTVAAGVAKGHADMILISGGDGGTGASPRSSIMYAGLPWELGLSESHQTLVLNDLRGRVRLQTDGQMRTGRDVAIAALLGAEEFGFCTAILVSLGCVMLRHCHLNNCSVGVATQDELLEKRFTGRAEYVENYMRFVVTELREIMASLGVRTIDEMVGRTELLEINEEVIPDKSKGVDLSRILYKPQVTEDVAVRCVKKQDHQIDRVMDLRIIDMVQKALEKGEKVELDLEIKNFNRTTGAMLSGRICELHGERGLPTDTVYCRFRGTAGQSFAAFLARGITFELEGLANDYVGKGMSGGKLIIYPGRGADYASEENIIMGNTAFYGATSGEAYVRGVAGERFCIRNSGLYAVVEGVGDHGCEYMTGGRVVILGRTGRNFAAGMSGGIAYIYDREGDFRQKCNLSMVCLEELNEDDMGTVYEMLHNHKRYTKSARAQQILDDFTPMMKKFVKVMPLEYKRILESKKIEDSLGLSEVSDG
ncbi:MAG: glutamate synthase large subunit [Candidatus Omnitrophica bacterium]|nr:glutamate synthase large subunit [Candidatus Omnitrophota bacterium]